MIFDALPWLGRRSYGVGTLLHSLNHAPLCCFPVTSAQTRAGWEVTDPLIADETESKVILVCAATRAARWYIAGRD